jgi:hypothetical protein
MAKWLSSRDKKWIAWIAAVWTAIVVVVAFFQDDVVRALFLGLTQEALLLGAGLLISYVIHRRKSSATRTREP